MKICSTISWAVFCLGCGLIGTTRSASAQPAAQRFISPQTAEETVSVLTAQHGSELKDRIESGVGRVAALWWDENDSEKEFSEFCKKHFIADEERWVEALNKTDSNLEVLRGHLHMIDRALRSPFQLNLGDPQPEDHLFVSAIPGVDFFKSKTAFFIALNFPQYSLEEMLEQGPQWTRQQWAAARIGEMFPVRIPADIQKEAAQFSQGKGEYFQNYFVHMDRVLTPNHRIIFPDGDRLSCHHGLRDNLKGQYSKSGGLVRQELIYAVMLRIIDQTIPKQVIGNPDVYWEPRSNSVYKKEKGKYASEETEPEENLRYQVLLNVFRENKVKDACYPAEPTYIQRTFNDRQMTEESVEALILSILNCPEAAQVAELISTRIGRSL